ncbi:TonB-dependent receptor plug domain-containing protein [Blastomonas fulva]|uniref:TonB-dependent receptor plug domain-containing protein n=1 Tax=Blastomonas fulva TaxID=1550728 RepID=UPI003F715A7D
MKQTLRYIRLISPIIVSAITVIGSPAFAQTVEATSPTPDSEISPSAPDAVDDENADTNEILVTGSLIRNAAAKAQAPVLVLNADEANLRQANTAQDLLRDLPGAVAGIGSAVNNVGVTGTSTVNLRGLGSNRNLVLLDGNRVVPSDLTGVTDLNNIPLALIARTEVLTGGASTTYGADAISGVVNFITRQDFVGAEISASSQITQEGDGAYQRIDLTLGADFADGRGNAVLSIGYQKSDPIYQSDRDFSLFNVNSFTGQEIGSGTGVPSTISIAGTRLNGLQVDAASGALIPAYRPYNFNTLNLLQTPFERYNVYGATHYDLGDDVTFYMRGIYSHNVVTSVQAPSGSFGSTFVIPLSNPYLPVAARNQICSALSLNAAQCAAASSAGSLADPNYRTVRANLFRRAVEVGPRIFDFTTDQFDARAGFRGAISDSVSFDVSGAYGESRNTQNVEGYIRISRLADALLATNPVTCLSGNPGCVPVNVFGDEGSITPEMAQYLTADSSSFVKTSLGQIRGVINGDLGTSLPWASDMIDFAFGAEYRSYTASQAGDELSSSGDLGGNTGAILPIDGRYDVVEAFSEISIPVIQDMPGIENLLLNGGIRYSSYKIFAPDSPTFNTTTWKAGGEYSPVRGLRFRGGYQRAVRAPNIGELFSPSQRTLSSLNSDRCAGGAPTTNPILRSVCLAQGAPASAIGFIPELTSGLANNTSGGNPNLSPENSDSYTVGLVIEPSVWLDGLSATVDYYHIKIVDAISAPSAAEVYGLCFNNLTGSSAASSECTQIRRNPVDGSLLGSDGVPGVPTPLTNAGKYETAGIDVGVNYRRSVGMVDLDLSFNGNWTSYARYQATPGSVNRDCAGFYSVSCGSLQPEISWTLRTTLIYDAVSLSLLWRHIGPMEQEPLSIATGGLACCGYDRIAAYDLFDLTARFELADRFTFVATAQNLFDRDPPFVGANIGPRNPSFNQANTFPSTYDALGRRFAVGVTVTF